ncbi:cobalt transporter subunit CbtB [Roseivivax marinus]|uniref:CbtB domain-containing protein n=1 Tax=Roseivivax marinus TaxID=1379903 RepID=UPI0008B968F2|nr:CbtB domain-containing protein [Roseivivax marinus]SEL89078.1 cobalt transporter subunit CbtB [Roseivivax marinus]
MNVQSTTATPSRTGLLGAGIFAALIGLGMIVVTGHVQADTLHDAAHDVRHATGFPCH